jgi:hypothetical protein
MATAAGANITTSAGFPEHISWRTLPSADGSILVSDLKREPPPADRLHVDSVLVRTFATALRGSLVRRWPRGWPVCSASGSACTCRSGSVR